MSSRQDGFSGSYRLRDCHFLLTPLSLNRVNAALQPTLPGWEDAPHEDYLCLYQSTLLLNCSRVAQDVACLASVLNRKLGGNIVLASLARAGTPFGVLLARALRLLGRTATHYGISLIHKYGVDHAALDYIFERHDEAGFRFVDGWTGKGGISRVLAHSTAEYNRTRGTNLSGKLTVVSDLAGVAEMAATDADYFVPTSPINAPMNGLISKTFGKDEQMKPDDFHGTFELPHLAGCDRSNHFLDAVSEQLPGALNFVQATGVQPISDEVRRQAALRAQTALPRIMAAAGSNNEDLIKHGYCETVRAMQRRPVRQFWLRNPDNAQNSELIAIARKRGIEVVHEPLLEYECVGICSR